MMHACEYKQTMKNWGNAPDFKWDICATWHVPNEIKQIRMIWDDRRHEVEMRKYFNTVDRHIFKAAHRNRGERVWRWVVMEKAGGVGWHSHALLKTPEHMSQQAFIDTLCGLWYKHCGIRSGARFQSYLFKAELVDRDFFGYTVKDTKFTEDAKGVFDEHNTYLPKL